MFCKNCGKQIPDDTKFCSYCGTMQTTGYNMNSAPNQQNYTSQTTGNQQSGYTAPQPQKTPPKKKKNNILVVILVVLAMSGIGTLVGKSMAKSYVDDSKSDGIVADNTLDTEKTDASSVKDIFKEQEAETKEESVQQTEENQEYTKIFRDRFIVQAPAFFVTQETASFAKVTEEGIVESMQIGYSDDVITDMVETIYIDVSTMSDSEKEAMDATLSSGFSKCREMGFLTVSTNMETNYYSFSCKMTGLDEKDNLMAAVEEGLLSVDDASAIDFLSMEATESSLLANGYVKK